MTAPYSNGRMQPFAVGVAKRAFEVYLTHNSQLHILDCSMWIINQLKKKNFILTFVTSIHIQYIYYIYHIG